MAWTMRDQVRESAMLRYTDGKRKNSSALRKIYLGLRARQLPPIPERCDIKTCRYHTELLIWNGRPFKLILDHENGVNTDNRAKNLRLLCPLCNSQQSTHGGGNKGRVIKSAGGFGIRNAGGGISYTMPVESASMVAEPLDIGLWHNGQRR